MLEGLSYLISPRPWPAVLRDVADILIVAFIIYRALLVLKGTRAMQMGMGFVAFGLLYLMARYLELATLMQVLSYLAAQAILIMVVVFQNDIRRALIRVGSKAWRSRRRDAQERVIDEVVSAATELARHRMGALMCLERDANVLEFVKPMIGEGGKLEPDFGDEIISATVITKDGEVVHELAKQALAGGA